MINQGKEVLLLSNSVKLKGGKALLFYSTLITKQDKETTETEVKILNPDRSFNYLDQYKRVDDTKTQMGCKEIQQEILNRIMQDLTDGTLTIKGVNA